MLILMLPPYINPFVTSLQVYGFAEGPLPLSIITSVNLPQDDEGFCMVMLAML